MVDESLSSAWLPEGVRVYAIGDVHGCDEKLAALHQMIAAHHAARPARRPGAQVVLVHLGDYVDRGPDSRGVIARLRGPSPLPGATVVNLVGNHEQMMLAALHPAATEEMVELWLENGAVATLDSYGLAPRMPEEWGALPAADRAFLRGLRPSFALGGYFFAHAGVRPDVPLDRQDPMDLAWIREPFLSHDGALGAVVVHGHTPAKAPEVKAHRIGLDTGAVYGGKLTCGVFEGDRVGFLQV
jgi:serine/threonine protein phosphatase 1